MVVFCRGFNLYRQLNLSDPVVSNFVESFHDNSSKNIQLNYSFSIINSDALLIYCSQVKKSIVNVSECGKIIDITSNDLMILILNDLGQIFKIELPNLDLLYKLPKITANGDIITRIKAGSKLNVAYSKNGKLFNIPNELDFINRNLIDFKTGREHCILLDTNGKVYSFGRGSRGQLGHGTLDDEPNPKLVEALAGIKIVQISAGGWHSCAISQDGDLYSWGWNGNGQLGLSNNSDNDKSVSVMASPHVVDFEDMQINVLKVACGGRHTITLLDNGNVYGCGWNKYKQLTEKDEESYNTFTHLRDFSNKTVEDLKCGPWNSAVICK